MRILFVLSRVPYPLEKGDKLRAFHLIRELSKRHEVVLFCLADEKIHPRAETELKRYCSEVYIHRIPLLIRGWNLLQSIFGPRPFQVDYFYSNTAQRAFDQFLEENLPQHIYCQLIRTARYVKKYRTIPKTLDYMDAFSAGMEKMAKRAKPPVSWLMDIECKRLQRFEQEAADWFQHHTIISEQDAACIRVSKNIHVIPNGIDPVFFEEREVPMARDLLFAGNMSYRPNVESARFLVQEVMPLLWKKHPELRLTLAGANPSAAVQGMQNDRVEVTGWVDDIHEVYASSKVFVAPMLINSGLQNKLLEAMASKLPCVTTTLANNALGALPEQQILLANTAEETAQAIERILASPSESERLAASGHAFVTSTYSWEKEAVRLESIISPQGAMAHS